ncbi:hypothetical protein C7974DRAFT_123006 [Boeremia exigua]|uniref:uncharacterized protein n=1 Tax=Boeremia exigua TaxID=749465 RepID=UPI001E8D7319|nr:uncharacterized protein C7974DRAFT_123006 [Boeremia exigua]KAH6638890.1 hypothetical protein C7974DRAFT_123006 [Boeremia exigua]
MARTNRLSRISDRSFHEAATNEPELAASKIKNPAPHRQLSLLTITAILNTLFWSSAICSVIALFQIASDSRDHSNILPGILTLVSAIVTIAYTIVHTTYSVKQRALTYQQLDLATIKKTTYVANRLVVSLCVLWLLTAGWNMIMVARRPSCLPNQADGQSWEAGITCLISRVGMAFASIALVASLILFGMMAAVRRPFEAHLFAYGQRQTNNAEPTPPASRWSSDDRFGTEKLVYGNGMTTYNHARRMSNTTNADVETLDLNASSRPASIVQSPTPPRDRMGVFTSPFAPPPLPSAFMKPVETSPSLRAQTPTLGPFAHRGRLSLTTRTDALLAPAAYVPHSIPIEFSASAQRAIFPDATAPYRSIGTSRSQPHLRSMSSFSNRHHYSRSVSLSRPQRLSSMTPVPHLECSSRSDTMNSFSGISEAGESNKSKTGASSTDQRASTADIVRAIASNTRIPGTERKSPKKHWRTVSAPDAVAAAQQARSGQRMAIGWKPILSKSSTMLRPLPSKPVNVNKFMRSASAELLGRFGAVASSDAEDKDLMWKKAFEREIEDRLNDLHAKPPTLERQSMSTDTETLRESYDAGSLKDEMRFEDVKEVLVMWPVSRDIALVR